MCHLSFGYGERMILDDISLEIPRGKVTALMGASGGGKTTVLRLIGGQIKAQQGQMLFDGQDITPMNQTDLYAARRRMGMLFQFAPCLLIWMSLRTWPFRCASIPTCPRL